MTGGTGDVLQPAAMTEARARQTAGWTYDGDYAIYDHPSWDRMRAQAWGLTDPATREQQFVALVGAAGETVGFLRFMERSDGVDVGLGLRPDHCGRGLGALAMEHLHIEADRRFGGRTLRLAVRDFNRRAIRCYERAGWEHAGVRDETTALGPGTFVVMERVPAKGADVPDLRGPEPGEPAVVDAVLRALPDWFGIEQSIRDYVRAAPELATWTLYDRGRAIGFLAVKRHHAHSAEVHVMGVLPEHHRRGLGSRMLRAAEAWLAQDGVHFVQVKTLSPARADDAYERTRAFYEAHGYVPLEDFPDLWDPGNPCRLYIKSLP